MISATGKSMIIKEKTNSAPRTKSAVTNYPTAPASSENTKMAIEKAEKEIKEFVDNLLEDKQISREEYEKIMTQMESQ